MCPDQDLQEQPTGPRANAQSAEPHQPGLFLIFIYWFLEKGREKYWFVVSLTYVFICWLFMCPNKGLKPTALACWGDDLTSWATYPVLSFKIGCPFYCSGKFINWFGPYKHEELNNILGVSNILCLWTDCMMAENNWPVFTKFVWLSKASWKGVKTFLVVIWILCFRSLWDYPKEVADMRPSVMRAAWFFLYPKQMADYISTVNGLSSGLQEIVCPAVHISLH